MKKLISVFLCILISALLCSPATIVSAHGSVSDCEIPCDERLDHIESAANISRVQGMCSICYEYTYLLCPDECIYLGGREHFSLKGTCTVRSYGSTSYRYCGECKLNCEQFGTHICWEYHSVCAKGPIYDVCIAEYKEVEVIAK